MASTFRCIKLHVVFGTRDRVPSITPEIHPRLHAYLGGIARNLGAHPLMIGGVEDHVHLLLDVPPKLAPANLIRDLKSNSSGWIHESFPRSRKFHWQTGYGAFSVSPTAVPNVMRYIERQEEHHRRVSYADEMRRILREAGLEFDERWLAG
ncbi:MAG: IS200/IS605 family transposase [Thermoanaerobaculia bacterium]